MSKWFQDRRQEFIAATLRQFGQVRRADLMRGFDVSLPQASADIAAFLASDPPYVTYDVSGKAYVLEEPRECPSSPDGRHHVDTSMESGPHNCFHCEQPMPRGTRSDAG